jgi:hypothetical protein
MVVPSKEAKTSGAAGIDAEGGRRPTAVPAPATAAPRRLKPLTPTFTPATHSAMPSMPSCCGSELKRRVA